MANPLVFSLPAGDADTREIVEGALQPYGEVYEQPPAALDLETVKLIVEIGAGVVSAVGGSAALVNAVLDIREKLRKAGKAGAVRVGRAGTRGVPLDQADEQLLRSLLDPP